jgi:hypothetical protein
MGSIDPMTLDIPSDPFPGFLPPNSTPPAGEAYVTFRIRPRADAPTGTRINALATVVFDEEPPLDTAPVFNTIDSGPPTSSVNPLPAVTTTSSFTVSWSGSDDPGGSGIARYDVFVSDNGGPFVPFMQNTTLTSATFTGVVGHTYGFYSVATDNVGHIQPTPTGSQATTTLSVGLVNPPASPVFPVHPTADLYAPHPNRDTQEAFVKGLYHAVLGRDGEAAGLAFWLNDLAAGATREQVAAGFVNSAEHRLQQVDAYYHTFLGRSASADAASNYWVGLLQAHGDEEEVLQGILTSPEYTAGHVRDHEFVSDLYFRLLGRTADGGGTTFWEQRLGTGMSRADVVDGFLRSREAAEVAEESFYAAYLNRKGDPLREFWIGSLAGGALTYGGVATGFLAAPEFLVRAGENVP